MSRIRSNMSAEARATVLGDGDRDAFAVCMNLSVINNYYPELLDRFEIYGAAINRLYAICKNSLVTTSMILRACEGQVGGLTRDKLMDAINNSGSIDTRAIITQMAKRDEERFS